MSNKIICLDTKQASRIYSWIIDNANSDRKIEDCNCIKNILQQIKNNDAYSKFKDKLTHLVFAINDSQELIEDSKRFSIALSCYFLELNGYDYAVHYFAMEMENIVIWLADKRINKNLLSEIIESLIYEEEYSEELKLKIAISVS